MKKLFLFILLQFSLSNISLSQKNDNNYSQYFKEYSNNFKWNNFSFKTDYSNYYNDIIDLTDEEKIIYQSIFNESISDSQIVYKFNNKPIFQNIDFDDVFLSFGQNSDDKYFQNLRFIKYFNSNEDAKKFYLTNLNLLTKKFGITNVVNQNNIWVGGPTLFFILTPKENSVVFSVSTLNYNQYLGSLKQKYDYYYTSDKFKEIDKSNTFRGIKFGTNLESIKSITHLTKTFSNYEFVTKESKYINWNSIIFSLDGTHFGFSKEKKLSAVMLICDYYDEDGFIKLKQQIIDILGSETIRGKFIIWVGDNLTIYMNKDFISNDDKDKTIVIQSNKHTTFFEKDY